MDCAKTGQLICKLRKEKDLTQKQVADALGVGNKAVSKWECGLGCPDASLWPELSVILGADIVQILEGEISLNKPDTGNVDKAKFYVCPHCNNVLLSTGTASIFCCGRKVEKLTSFDGGPKIDVEIMDGEYYIKINHPMTRESYVLFAAYVKWDKVFLNRLYPEQEAAVRVPYMPGGKLYVYYSDSGLGVYKIK